TRLSAGDTTKPEPDGIIRSGSRKKKRTKAATTKKTTAGTDQLSMANITAASTAIPIKGTPSLATGMR
ncbi:MAG: hypothetical protein JRF20_09440, partial [Deltaproteobacteria bacterium]|nr:hypothetical protein [Deltaproteobacteria bacterium]